VERSGSSVLCRSTTDCHTALLLHRFTGPQLHGSRAPLLHRSTAPQLHYLHGSTAPLLHGSNDCYRAPVTQNEPSIPVKQHLRTLLQLVWRKLRTPAPPPAPVVEPRPAQEPASPAEPLIDVRELIRTCSIDDLNRTAENYFSSLKNYDFHLAKPFGNIGDAPAILINFATVLQGMRLAPGLRVLDFGAGSGWTSRFLTQLGCEVIVLDVSETALKIARELFERHPVIGDCPKPRFLQYDGRTIDLPDASVERILCFDSFHHAPNPDAVIHEFARILTPGGIAAFAEPGPEHSKSVQSQFEMRTYGVIENDIHIEEIWATAQRAGFSDLQLAAFNLTPYHVSLERHADLLAGGETFLRWAEITRASMGNVRDFFLTREGTEPLDSRQANDALRATIAVDVPQQVRAGEPIPVKATITNAGTATWLPSGTPPGGVSLGCHLLDATGGVREHDFHWQNLSDPPRRIEPGEMVHLQFTMPALSEGKYTLEFDCVADRVCWFAQVGSKTERVPVSVSPM